MSDENLKSIIYISKRCPYCRKLLLLLQNKPELKGSIQITSIDDEPLSVKKHFVISFGVSLISFSDKLIAGI